MTETAAPPRNALPLFPLQAVLFPGGVLNLKVFEARYLDLVSRSLREDTPFGVVCLNQGSDVHTPGGERVRFAFTGTDGVLRTFDGKVNGGRIDGQVSDGHKSEKFSATRKGEGPAIETVD